MAAAAPNTTRLGLVVAKSTDIIFVEDSTEAIQAKPDSTFNIIISNSAADSDADEILRKVDTNPNVYIHNRRIKKDDVGARMLVNAWTMVCVLLFTSVLYHVVFINRYLIASYFKIPPSMQESEISLAIVLGLISVSFGIGFFFGSYHRTILQFVSVLLAGFIGMTILLLSMPKLVWTDLSPKIVRWILTFYRMLNRSADIVKFLDEQVNNGG